MTGLRFERDPARLPPISRNTGSALTKRSVFGDARAKLIGDPDHSEDEDRFVLLGLSISLRMLVVCHCCRSKNNSIRIISARKATATESRIY